MSFFRSESFVIRMFCANDVDACAAYRSDPSTAQYQSWTVPYPRAKAQAVIEEYLSVGNPTDGKRFSFALADPETDALIGDVAVHLGSGGRSAEIGYTVAPGYRRRGIASGATAWVIGHLFDELGVQRIHASLHPENVPSMMVLEQLGFMYEGTARQSYWVGDICTDDPQFGLLRSDWVTWHQRTRDRPANVELVNVTPRNAAQVFSLETHFSQRRFVSPMGKSAADALVPDVDDDGGVIVPWFRAVVADGVIVGFVMVAAVTPTLKNPFLWRLLIDRVHQRRGIGTKVLELLASQYRAAGHEQLLVSWKPGIGSPEPLYLNYGFALTGEQDEGEVVGALDLSALDLSALDLRSI
jgi:RimJ/RimL family protein N-acetyltransferase